MADKLRPDELAAFKAAFDMFDKNQDGTISTKVSENAIVVKVKESSLLSTHFLTHTRKSWLCKQTLRRFPTMFEDS